MRLIALVLWLLAGLLLGGIVHLIAILILPRTATQDAFSRFSAIAPLNQATMVPHPSPQHEVLPDVAVGSKRKSQGVVSCPVLAK